MSADLIEMQLNVERAKNARCWAHALTEAGTMTTLEAALHASFLALRDIPCPAARPGIEQEDSNQP